MSEKSTTPDLVALVRAAWDASNRGDLDAVLSLCKPDGVWDASNRGIGTFEAFVYAFADDLIARITNYREIDEARAAAERLAEARG